MVDLANPEPDAKRRKTRGKYAKYSDQQRAKIGKYVSEHGNERARRHFLAEFPSLRESTVRYFKALYQQKLRDERKKEYPQPVTALPIQPRGRPPLLLDLDTKLISFLRAVRRKDGVINIHVVRATAEALISCNPAFAQQLIRFEMPHSWVQSIYRRMNFTRRVKFMLRVKFMRQPVPLYLREYMRSVDVSI